MYTLHITLDCSPTVIQFENKESLNQYLASIMLEHGGCNDTYVNLVMKGSKITFCSIQKGEIKSETKHNINVEYSFDNG